MKIKNDAEEIEIELEWREDNEKEANQKSVLNTRFSKRVANNEQSFDLPAPNDFS